MIRFLKILLNKYVIVAMFSSIATYQVIEPNTFTKNACKSAIHKAISDLARGPSGQQQVYFQVKNDKEND